MPPAIVQVSRLWSAAIADKKVPYNITREKAAAQD